MARNLHVLKTMLTWVVIFNAFALSAQKAYIGGNQTLPVLNAQTYSLENTIYGFSSQLRWLQSSSDHSFIYGGTIFYQPELNLYKIDAATDEIIITKPVQYTVQDLEISDDDQFIFHHNSTTVYKIDAGSLEIADTVYTGKIISYIAYYDNNTVFASSTERIYKLDFETQSITDSVVFGNFDIPAEMAFNADKSKLYAIKSSLPLTLWVIDITSMTVENTISLSGMIGSPGDLILSQDGNYLYVTSTGSNQLNGTIRVLAVPEMTTVTDVEKDFGSGIMSFAPNGDLWIPNNTSQSVAVFDTQSNVVKETFSTQGILNGPFSIAFGTSTTGVDSKVADNCIQIYPNPASEYITIKMTEKEQGPYHAVIKNACGQTVKCYVAANNDKLDVSQLNPGIYFMEIKSKSNYQNTRFLIR